MTSLSDVFEARARWHVALCDCRFGMASLPAESVDAMVTDPPAGIFFMGRTWDSDRGGRANWITWLADIMREALRVLKPGGHGLVWALPRTSHWTATALEDAGFEIRDIVTHLFATGFPKSANISKLIDARNGDLAARPVVRDGVGYEAADDGATFGHGLNAGFAPRQLTSAASAASAAWDGWGTALKPASEHWILVRKPLDGTIAANVLAHCVGGLNIDACRIACSPDDQAELAAGVEAIRARGGSMANSWKNSSDLSGANPASPLGRWPANVVLSHADECELVGAHEVHRELIDATGKTTPSMFGAMGGPVRLGTTTETVEDWRCVAGCPVRLLDEQSGDRPGMSGGGQHRADYPGGMFGGIDCTGTARADKGGASRFFFTSKASRAERDAGLEDFAPSTAAEATGSKDGQARLESPRTGAGRTGGARNTHPTAKRVDLMRYLCRLVTPTGGIVLDPFTGSGSTGVAAMLEGLRFVGMELDPLHVDFARARIAHKVGGDWEREVPERRVEPRQASLFGGAR